ncbi:hypothetical protein SPRG_13748 [Saprolegnia parasitica CBS 223.65]|uniref:LysM domain-containing protein n=1 Tax=Saprolegnia parasitica (strain CBS 223.65) TaxID=695850 RepID=A0A067C1D4_SAPPC|nr:hypothetical protein SPRG_13748 [Saprolegnia parasitica CBS 223.65]KDO20366.1 hypothetical protein SPRG_13748 [Saprolegnia parasitica CBS 223.65]|eukprot:XP_012208894.1 hypothetical protein SPRG_13748 [Saprolegnia parasitica CBS 223.65]
MTAVTTKSYLLKKMRSYLALAVLCLSLRVDAAKCTDAEITTALTPYSGSIASAITLCANDMGYTQADLVAGKFLSSSMTPAQVTVFLKSGNCHTVFAMYQLATGSLPCASQYQGVTFEQFAATITLLPSSTPVTRTPKTATPATSECADSVVVAAFTPVDKERTRLLERCAIDMGSIPVQYLYNGTLKAKITDAQFTAFVGSSDCAAAITIEKKAWGTITPPCQIQFHSLLFSTAEISTWSFKEYAQRFYDRSIPSTNAPPGGSSSGNVTPSPSRTTAKPGGMPSASAPSISISLLLSLVLASLL